MSISLPIAVHVFLSDGDKMLFIKRNNTGFHDGEWSVPAGRLDENETIREGASREAKEEVGVSIEISDLGSPLVMHHKDERGERIYFFFVATKWSGNPKNVEKDKSSEVRWFSKNNLPQGIIPHIRKAHDLLREDTSYCEYGF